MQTILVVEDNPDVLAVTVGMLEQLRYRAIAVDSARAALKEIAAGQQIDLAFIDVMLPGDLDGLALAFRIRERHAHIPVLLTSGYSTALSARHGLPMLRKPYRLDDLARAMEEQLARAQETA
jgi:CheY-like chemotaxis protein